MKKVHQVFKALAKVIKRNPDILCQYALAKDRYGCSVLARESTAVSFCPQGMVIRLYAEGTISQDLSIRCQEAMAKYGVPFYNDVNPPKKVAKRLKKIAKEIKNGQ